MDKLDQVRIFLQVAEMGSFIKAAHALDVPRATVSAAVQQLETGLGTRLLHRTTRQVQLTADGALLLERGRRLLAEADELDRLFRRRDRDVIGRLNVDVPSRIARRVIAPALPSLFRRHPKLQLSLGSTDRSIDLVQEGVDCAIRVGRLADSSLVVRPLGQFTLINCASPDYLREYGVPEHPEALAHGHWAIGYASPTTGRELGWEYCADGGQHTLTLPSRVIVNNAETYIAGCIAGMGLIQIPRFDVAHLLDSGALVDVMPAYRAAPMDVSAVYPHRRHRSRRLNAFIEWFGALMADALAGTGAGAGAEGD
ncbi:LysR family transcriptional regulator [Burkholderia sp. Z1]|uniref:LysR family transcriptional regulator n=1 Tax=Burkholderia sp. Z1 TaxID=2759039 RepID=UPI0018663C06|nr:LysR family transcriptional regulator [Burkholderia sp. Z1]